MSLLRRYYLTTVGFVAAMGAWVLNFERSPLIAAMLFVFVLALGAFNKLGFRCPACGKLLSMMWTGPLMGFPGRRCTRCDADLDARA
jgi:hypothetical protein